MAKEQKRVNWDKLISGIQGQHKDVVKTLEKKVEVAKQVAEQGAEPGQTPSEAPVEATTEKEVQKGKADEKETPPKEQPDKPDEKPEEKPEEKPKEEPKEEPKQPPEQPPKDEMTPMLPQAEQVSKDMSNVGKLKTQPPAPPKQGDSKLNVHPSKNGMCVCPICGHMHPKGGAHVPSPSAVADAGAGQQGSSGGKLT